MPLTPTNYLNSVIYKIEHINNPELIYVGSTTNFIRRRADHKKNCNKETNKKYNIKLYQMMRQNGGFNEFKIMIIKNYPCNNKIELVIEEEKHRKEFQTTLNSIRAHTTTEERKEQQQKTDKKYYKQNKEQIIEQVKEYYEANKEQIKKQKKEYYEDNKEQIAEYNKEYYENNKEQRKKIDKEYYEANKEQIKEQKKEYREQNKDKINQRRRELRKLKIEEEKKNKFGSPEKFDVITNEDEKINIFLSDDVNILKCLIDEVREDNKKYDADDEKEAPKAVLNKKDDNTDDETDDEDPTPPDDPEIIDIFVNGYKTQIQVY